VVVDLTNIVMMELAHVILDSLEQFVISEHAPMIVSDMDIASMVHVIVVLVGLEMIVL